MWARCTSARRGGDNTQNETWLAHWERVKASIGGPGVTLALTGARGTGKTQLGTAAGWDVCYSDRSTIYSRAAMLSTRIKSSYGHDANETEAKVLKEVIGTQLLVLDEIGETRETDFEGKMMANIVCQRHDYLREESQDMVRANEALRMPHVIVFGACRDKKKTRCACRCAHIEGYLRLDIVTLPDNPRFCGAGAHG